MKLLSSVGSCLYQGNDGKIYCPRERANIATAELLTRASIDEDAPGKQRGAEQRKSGSSHQNNNFNEIGGIRQQHKTHKEDYPGIVPPTKRDKERSLRYWARVIQSKNELQKSKVR